MPGTRTADKAFGESMDHKPSMLQPSQGQLEGQQKTEEDVIKFLQEVFPDIEINIQNYQSYYREYLQNFGIR